MKPDSIEQSCARWQQAREAREYFDREAWKDLRFIAGKTLKPEEIMALESQNRDIPNHNYLDGLVQMTCGLEAQNRSDLEYLPKVKGTEGGAKAATKLYMNIRDENSADRQYSRQFQDVVKVGIGWHEVGYNPDPTGVEIIIRRENPFFVYPDPCGKEADMSDWIDMHRSKILYPHVLADLFPKFRNEIMNSRDCWGTDAGNYSHTSDWTGTYGDVAPASQWDDMGMSGAYGNYLMQGNRPRQIRAVERWYTQTDWAKVIKFRDGRTFEPDPDNKDQLLFLARALLSKQAKMLLGPVKRMRVAMFLPDDMIMLGDNETPLPHNRFPLIPMWGYEDEYGRPQGLIRQLRSPQRDINLRMAHLLKKALTRQTHYEVDAFTDLDQAIQALADPAGMVEYAADALRMGKVVIKDNLEATPLEGQILDRDISMIHEGSAITPELQGQSTNKTSGVAIDSQKQTGQTRLFTLLDNRNWCIEQSGALLLPMIRETYTEEQAIRSGVGPMGAKWLTINERMPDGTVSNNIAEFNGDIKVSLTNMQATHQMAMLEKLNNYLAALPPEMQIAFADKVAELAGMADDPDFMTRIQELQQMMLGGLPQQQAQPGQPMPDQGQGAPIAPQGMMMQGAA